MPYTPNKIVSGTLKADYNLFWNSLAPFYDDHRAPAQDLSADPQLTSPSAFAYKFDEKAVWLRTVTVHDILAAYRAKYLPKASSPVLGSGDPSIAGPRNFVGAIGDGTHAPDGFGR